MSASSKKTFAGLTTGSFMPAPGSLADYLTPGQAQPFTIDVTGALGIRGPVITDEGGLREDFPGVALSADWTAVPGVGVGIAVGAVASSVSFPVPAGALLGDRAYISREIDFLPIVGSIALNNLGARVAGYEFFWGFYSDMDPAVARATGAYVEQRFAGTATQCSLFTQSGPGDAETSAAVAIVTTLAGAGNCSWRTIALDGESAIFRDVNTATNALPTTNVKATRSRHLPGLYQPLYFAMGIEVTAGIGIITAADTYSVDTAFVKNTDRLVVNTSF